MASVCEDLNDRISLRLPAGLIQELTQGTGLSSSEVLRRVIAFGLRSSASPPPPSIPLIAGKQRDTEIVSEELVGVDPKGFVIICQRDAHGCGYLRTIPLDRKSYLKSRGLRKPDAWMPRLSENLGDVKPQTLKWLKQLGCTTVIYQGTDDVDHDRKGYWTVADILPHKQNCIDAGMTLESMMIPIDTYLQARLGKPGRDREIENVCKTIQAVGQAGIPMMEWRFWPDFYWDNSIRS